MHLTILLFVKKGMEPVFQVYEEHVLPILNRHNGKLLYRLRPTETSWLAFDGPTPYEIHLVYFGSQQDFDNYRQDEERKSYSHLFQDSVEKVVITAGTLL